MNKLHFAILFCFSCSNPILPTAKDNCIDYYKMVDEEFPRCDFTSNFTPENYCKCTVIFNQTKSSIEECRTELRKLTCDEIKTNLPEVCKVDKKDLCSL